MPHQFSGLAEVYRRPDINPGTLDWVICHLAAGCERTPDKVGGVAMLAGHEGRQQRVREDIDAGIGII